MSGNLNDIYTEIVMEHSMSNHNKRNLDKISDEEHGHNPSCGDDITIQIRWRDDIIEDISYMGSGCAISKASTSVMIDLLKGKTRKEAIVLTGLFMKMIRRETLTEAELDMLEDARAFENISNMPARVKCAQLAWYTMETLLNR